MDISGINQHASLTQCFGSLAGPGKLNNVNESTVTGVKQETQDNESMEAAYYQSSKNVDVSITNDISISQPTNTPGAQQDNTPVKQLQDSADNNSNKSPSNLILGTLVDKKV